MMGGHYKVFYYRLNDESDEYDPKVYDSEQGGRPPPRGTQVILQDHARVGVESVSGSDFYVKRKGRWYGVDKFGLFDYLMDSGLVLFGMTVTAEEFDAIMRTVQDQKHGWTALERK